MAQSVTQYEKEDGKLVVTKPVEVVTSYSLPQLKEMLSEETRVFDTLTARHNCKVAELKLFLKRADELDVPEVAPVEKSGE